MELREKKINFLGDSITYGEYTTCPQKNRFSTLIGEMVGAEIRNYGISGTRIAVQQNPSANPQFDQDFCSRVAGMDPDADIVVVFGGTNDFNHGDAPFGTFADRTPETFYGALHTLMLSLLEKYPGKCIVFMTPLHRTLEDNPNSKGLILADYVAAIQEVAAYYGLPVLDLFRTSGIQPRVDFVRERFCPDGLHPNDAGHVLLANRVKGFLETL